MLNNSIKHFTDFFESSSRNLVKLVCIWLCKKVKCYYKYFWTQCYIYWAEYYTHSLLLYTAYIHMQWRPTKVETTGATLNYETLISRLFETFLDFETKKHVVPRHTGSKIVVLKNFVFPPRFEMKCHNYFAPKSKQKK